MVDTPPRTRERILDAAQELFADLGYDATPTAKVAAAAGVPKGLVFYHFPRKIDLLTALFQERMPDAVPHEVDEIAVPGDVAGSLLALAERLTGALQRSILVRTILWREADTHPEVARCLRAYFDEVVEFAARLIERAAPGLAAEAGREAAARAWVGTVSLALNTTRLGGTELDLRVVADLIAAGLRGLGGRTQAAQPAMP